MTSFSEGLVWGLAAGGSAAAVMGIFALRQWRKAVELAAVMTAREESMVETRKTAEEWRPLHAKLADFELLVRDTYEREGRERFHLEKEIASLARETHVLASSLRGDSKAQGDWGEVLVEKILESSGLRAGAEFDTQSTYVDDEGRTLRPDVVVKLPGERALIIDAKVSLTAWDRYCRAEDETEREQAMDEHIESLRRHIQSLGSKRYHEMKGAAVPEFVFLFTRVEPAWIEALRFAPQLLEDATKAGIAVVSPTTLFASLKTVAALWGRERQNKNALRIADEAGKLYDKFVQFTGDLSEVERDLAKANDRLLQAKRKLVEGPGNLASRAEKIRELGAKSTKKLSDVLRDELNPMDLE